MGMADWIARQIGEISACCEPAVGRGAMNRNRAEARVTKVGHLELCMVKDGIGQVAVIESRGAGIRAIELRSFEATKIKTSFE